jgi:hypothetical protein
MAETILLDPSAVSAGRTQITLTSFVDMDGPDWGDAQMIAYMSDQLVGSSSVDSRLPNRTVKIPLNLRTTGGVSFSTIRLQLQQKAALWQREGGWVGRQVGSTTLYADVVPATAILHLGGDIVQAYLNADVNAVLTFDCIPDFYGDEVTLDTITSTGSCHSVLLDTGSTAVVKGNHPARCRIVVVDTSGNDQHGVLWALRSRYYDSASTAALVYEAEALTPLNGAAVVGSVSGASGGSVMRVAMYANAWHPFLATDISSGSLPLTHIGTYRVWARCASSTGTPQLRLAWSTDDTNLPTLNDAAQLPQANGAYFLLDLGVIRIDQFPIGANWWRGVLQTFTTSTGQSLDVDEIIFQPVDEFAGTLTAATQAPSYAVQQQLYPTAAANSAVVGTVAWTNPAFGYNPGNNSASAVLAAGAQTQYLKLTAPGFTLPTGATISQVSVYTTLGALVGYLNVYLVKGGTVITGSAPSFTNAGIVPGGGGIGVKYSGTVAQWNTTLAYTDVNASNFGVAFAWLNNTSNSINVALRNTTIAVQFTVGAGFTVRQDAALFGSRQTELRTEGHYREDAASGAYVPVSATLGDLPRLPPSGLESRPVELLVKPTRGDLATLADSGLDGFTTQVKYRPSFLYVGE